MAETNVSHYQGNIVYRVSVLCNWMGTALIFCMMVLTTVDVVLRSLLNQPITGALETTELLMLMAVALGLAYTQYQKGHVSVDILVSRFSRRTQAIDNIFVYLVCLGLYGLISWQAIVGGLRQQAAAVVLSQILPIPTYPFYFVLAFGGAMLCLVYILDLVEAVGSLFRGTKQ
jgi:TRAP-type transport system small permease protein